MQNTQHRAATTGGAAVPRSTKDWDARFRECADEFLFGREPSEMARLAVNFWRQLHGERRGRALDLGSGEGRDAIHLARAGFRVTAVDASEAALEKAQRLAAEVGAPEIDWCRMSVLDFPLSAGYDLLHAHNVLQFLGDHCLPTLRKLQEITPPGGLNSVSAFTREAEGLAGSEDLYRFDRNELKFHYSGWRILFYGEEILWRQPAGMYLSFARVIAEKPLSRVDGGSNE